MKNVFKLFLLTLISATFVVACSDDDTTTTPTDTEFIATYADFSGFATWDLLATNVGPDPSLAGFAHGDTNSTRKIYVNKSNVKMENGEWPVGTILFKQMNMTESGDLMGYMAMAKRGADFNIDNNGWEWFQVDIANDSILARAADMNNNGCNGCHGGAKANDYSFTLMNE